MHRTKRINSLSAIAVSSCLTTAAFAFGEPPIIVDMSDDVVDFGGSQEVDDLPGPDGRISFREALRAADNTPGPQEIHFNIPMSDWTDYNDRATLYLEGVFAFYSDNVTIDFSTQTDFTGDTNPNGNEVSIRGEVGNSAGSPAISVNGDNNTIIGLDEVRVRGYGIDITGHNNRVLGCTITGPLYAGVNIRGTFNGPPASGNVIGGTEPGDGNTLASGNAGVRIDAPADNNVVVGNRLGGSVAGIQVRGAPSVEVYPHNNRIGGPTQQERNIIGGSGYTGEHGSANGELVAIEYAFGTIVEGNYIGTEEDGMTADQQIAPYGILLRNSDDTLIRNNLVAGINGYGIAAVGTCDNTRIHGNLIGTDKTGESPLPNWYGVLVSAWTSRDRPGLNFIGGTQPGESNVIAYNIGPAVVVPSLANGVRISGNSIHGNGGIGIELSVPAGADEVTPNDPNDIDENGGNSLQNFPEIDRVVANASSTRIIGLLNSHADEMFTIEFFANATQDATRFGEGQRFLGKIEAMTNSTNMAEFDVTLGATVGVGEFISATATRESTNETSEFAFNRIAEEGSSQATMSDFSMAFGTLLEGGMAELAASDDLVLRARSQFGFLSSEPNVIDLRIGSTTVVDPASACDITVEARLNNPGGMIRWRLRDWDDNTLEQVHSYTLGTTELRESATVTNAGQYVRDSDGRIEFSMKAVIVATFSLSGFQAELDQVAISIE